MVWHALRTLAVTRGLDARIGAGATVAVLAGLTAALAPLLGEQEILVATLVYLLVVLLASAAWGYRVGLFSAVLANLLLNFFFIPPLHTVTVQELHNVVSLALFLAVAVVGASMLSLLKQQLAVASERRAELSVMLDLSRELASAPTPERALESLAWSVTRAFRANRCEILQASDKNWLLLASTGPRRALTPEEASLARAAVETGQVVRTRGDRRQTTSAVRTSQPATGTYLPFQLPGGGAGVIHIAGALTAPTGSDPDALLRAFGDEAGVAIHRSRLAEQAREAEAARRSDEFKTALLSSVSHDLRSPLTAIKAAVGSLRSPEVPWTDADRENLLGAIESQTDRLTSTVSDLLDMSRLEGGAIQPDIEPIEARGLLVDAANRARELIGGRRIEVEGPDGLWVSGDYGLLLQALGNLIENAHKYSVAGGGIRLTARRQDGRVLIDVADEGPGIAAADLPRVFERFYRGTTSKGTQGTGLGLAIVRSLVELSGGEVTVDSSRSGTSFRIALPRVEAPL